MNVHREGIKWERQRPEDRRRAKPKADNNREKEGPYLDMFQNSGLPKQRMHGNWREREMTKATTKLRRAPSPVDHTLG